METEVYKARNRVRFVTAASLFDGHDAAINIMRRLLQASGVEVVHLGHNRSVRVIVETAIQEDVQGIAVSSYQGGHIEFFEYMVDLLRELDAAHIRVFGGGGGVIVPEEIARLHAYGVARIYSPDDGRELGLQGMINDMIRQSDAPTPKRHARAVLRGEGEFGPANRQAVAELISLVEEQVEEGGSTDETLEALRRRSPIFEGGPEAPVVGITGTGGAGKSSVTDELVRRFRRDFPERSVAVLSVDPSRQRTGGALLGDRIRMNSIDSPNVFMRSLATRRSRSELSDAIREAIGVIRLAGYDLVFLETSGIGQGDSAVAEIGDVNLYVMTSEYGAPSQLEKIEMLDFADLVAINKFDRPGSLDALRAVQKQYQRNRGRFSDPLAGMPVYGTVASAFEDVGVNALYDALLAELERRFGRTFERSHVARTGLPERSPILPADRAQYLREAAAAVRRFRADGEAQAEAARRLDQLEGAARIFAEAGDEQTARKLYAAAEAAETSLVPAVRTALRSYPELVRRYRQDELVMKVRDREIRQPLFVGTLSGLRVPRVAMPKAVDYASVVRYLWFENVPGEFPYTAGVFELKRADEEPRRQFAGEGTPARTNRRFHYLSKDDRAKRLSTAFDSVTLYGQDPGTPPDIYGKIGESGVSVCTLDDMEILFDGFDLTDPNTSVSMTINGPAPIILAMFLNAAIRQQERRFREENGREPVDEERLEIRERTLRTVRGTVQADILKEDQGQNTCIFSTEFALRMMGDVQQFFIDHRMRNYYSVSISGYHIAEAGANPVTQLAFTLANAFTYVEYYLSRGMKIDDFAPNLSFFFSNGMDPEYAVMGRVARRIWAVVMRNRYGANERSQKLKYHIQTSGRSLHAQEVDFNDIRTTLQALLAVYDHCNSLHTNAYDEAVTTPSEESVRRAMAIQMIINREFGLTKNENPLQGAYLVEELTDLVEEAVLAEFDRLNDRGGVLGAMELQYQRGKIQDESLHYETLKHSGELPIIGVNTFLNPRADDPDARPALALARASKEEKEHQISAVRAFQERFRSEAPESLARLQAVAREGGNLFAELMETVKSASLGQITAALYEVGGQYRRNM